MIAFMDIQHYEGGLVAVKLTDEERAVLGRAAHATVRALGKEATDKVALAREAGSEPGISDAEAASVATNKTILAIGSVTKRVTANRPPVYLTPMAAGLAVSVGEEGFTLLDYDEVNTTADFLQRYADTTVTAVEAYQHMGGLNTSAWERAHYGAVAERMSQQVSTPAPQKA